MSECSIDCRPCSIVYVKYHFICNGIFIEIDSLNYSFTLNLKLFTVMGISWILEIISTYNDNQITETLTDIYNIFLGVFIFFIFVFKVGNSFCNFCVLFSFENFLYPGTVFQRKVIHEFKCRIGEESEWFSTNVYKTNNVDFYLQVLCRRALDQLHRDRPQLHTQPILQ